MPRNQFQRMVFAFLTVVITVHAYFTQLFFIQPTVRVLFKALFKKDIEKRNTEMEENVKSKGKKKLPADETETVADIFKRIDEIKLEIKEEVIEELK